MWTDSNGHLYFTGGTERSQWNRGEAPEVLDTAGNTIRKLDSKRLISAWKHSYSSRLANGTTSANLYVSDDMGHIYRFTDVDHGNIWAQIFLPVKHPQGATKFGSFNSTRTAKPSISAERQLRCPKPSAIRYRLGAVNNACRTARPRRVSGQRRFHHRIRLLGFERQLLYLCIQHVRRRECLPCRYQSLRTSGCAR